MIEDIQYARWVQSRKLVEIIDFLCSRQYGKPALELDEADFATAKAQVEADLAKWAKREEAVDLKDTPGPMSPSQWHYEALLSDHCMRDRALAQHRADDDLERDE